MGAGSRGGRGFHSLSATCMNEVIPSFAVLSTAALLLASVAQIALLSLLVGRSRRRRQPRYVTLPQLEQPSEEDIPPPPTPSSYGTAQERAAWKGEMLRRFDAGRR